MSAAVDERMAEYEREELREVGLVPGTEEANSYLRHWRETFNYHALRSHELGLDAYQRLLQPLRRVACRLLPHDWRLFDEAVYDMTYSRFGWRYYFCNRCCEVRYEEVHE